MNDLPDPQGITVGAALRVAQEHRQQLAGVEAPSQLLEAGSKLQQWIGSVVGALEFQPSTLPLAVEYAGLSSDLALAALMDSKPDVASVHLAEANALTQSLVEQFDKYAAALQPCGPHNNLTYGGVCMRPRPCRD